MTAIIITRDTMLRLVRDEKYRASKAQAIVDAAPEGFDWTARGAVPARVILAHGWDTAPKQKTGPKGAQKETPEGVSIRVLSDAVRAIVKQSKDAEPGVIRLSLSGEGGATVTLRKGDKGYDAALKMVNSLK